MVQAKIISEKYAEINIAVQEQLDRGTTLFQIEGGHLRKPSMAVITVVSGRELQKLNRIVMDIDSEAFMVVSSGRRGPGTRIYGCETPSGSSWFKKLSAVTGPR
ncbi:MAG: YitT family protein [Pilosibacter sp.]